MQELKTCDKCSNYLWIEQGLKSCNHCLGGNDETRKYRRETAQKQYARHKRNQRVLLSLGRGIDLIICVFLSVYLLSGCVASSKALTETRKDVSAISKNVENLSKSHLNLTSVVADGLQLEEVQKKALVDNAQKIVNDSVEIATNTQKRESESVSAFSFGSILEFAYKIAEYADPIIGAISKAFGIPAPIAGSGMTLLLVALNAYNERKKKQAIAQENLKFQTYQNDEITKKKKEENDWKLYLASLTPEEAEKAIKANGV